MQNISLVDGGEDGQVLPMVPLLQPAREIDLIVRMMWLIPLSPLLTNNPFQLAVDVNADTQQGWPAGYGLYATYQRYANSSAQFGKIPLPKIPFVNTLINEGLNTHPTFFGCDSTTDVTYADSSTTLAPIIAYIPNYPWTYLSNISANAFQLSNDVSQSILDNGFQSATMAGVTSGSQIDWPTCLACASLQRSFERSGTAIPEKCQTCMSQYCWNGTVNDATPQIYSPSVGTPQWVVDGAKTKMSDGAISLSSHSRLVVAFFLFVSACTLL
jgi:lysophospholipase